MNINATFLRRQTDENGIPELVFSVPGLASQKLISDLQKMDYRLQISEIKSKRSIQQNNYMWAIIDEIALKTGNEAEDIYLHLLEKAGAHYEYIACLPEAEDSLKAAFRVIKLMNQFEHNGKTFNQYRCYLGSSKLKKDEMAKLIDAAIQLAAENNIILEEIYERY